MNAATRLVSSQALACGRRGGVSRQEMPSRSMTSRGRCRTRCPASADER
ncbi:hypothetical protein JNW91_24345 [Micromonospora sp. STR1_7]|uniref:Uncharacterized protein n=1 Tax=Micromonospora parastrephiae TaxID=2806101 RepID=A0ABS1XZL4_9ACTN|nr:hypothetical protein [Micromonospora parastrephiae]